MISNGNIQRAVALVHDVGLDAASEMLGVKRETLRRYVRANRQAHEQKQGDKPDEKLIRQLRERYNDAELRALVKGSYYQETEQRHNITVGGDEITIGVITDTHIGSKYTRPEYLDYARETIAAAGVDLVVHCGDVTEGLSNRAGHCYECTHLGYDAQLNESIRIFKDWDFAPLYMIDGNHDRWYLKASGALIVQDICKELDNATFCGHDEADLELDGGAIVRMWHGEDGSSYAVSYRIQKIIESFTGGEKPNVMICGHAHKSVYLFERHIHAVGAGSMQSQSSWMRSKRLPSHTGFWIINMTVSGPEVTSFSPTFYPLYM